MSEGDRRETRLLRDTANTATERIGNMESLVSARDIIIITDLANWALCAVFVHSHIVVSHSHQHRDSVLQPASSGH